MSSKELWATGDYYQGDMYRWQIRIEADGAFGERRQWIHPETQSGADVWTPTSHDWVLPHKLVLADKDELAALSVRVAMLEEFLKRVPWGPISAEHRAMKSLLVDEEDTRLWNGVERWLQHNRVYVEYDAKHNRYKEK